MVRGYKVAQSLHMSQEETGFVLASMGQRGKERRERRKRKVNIS